MGKNEKIEMVAKAAASTNPIGTFFVSIWNDYDNKFRDERIQEISEELTELHNILEKKISQDKIKDSQFYFFVREVLFKYSHENTKENRKAYRCCILNCTLAPMSNYSYDIYEKTVKILDSITRTELIVLYQFIVCSDIL